MHELTVKIKEKTRLLSFTHLLEIIWSQLLVIMASTDNKVNLGTRCSLG